MELETASEREREKVTLGMGGWRKMLCFAFLADGGKVHHFLTLVRYIFVLVWSKGEHSSLDLFAGGKLY